MAQENYLSNFSYIFIPFSLEQERHFVPFNDALAQNELWKPFPDKIRYLHRYVSDRLINCETKDDVDGPNMRHYQLKTCPDASVGLFFDRCYKTAPRSFGGKADETFDFKIADVQLFSFNTTICVMLFRLQFENNDPFHIAAAQYYLRKVHAEYIYVTTDDGKTTRQSFMGLAKSLLGDLIPRYNPDFFFYAAPDNAKANFFTYIDVPNPPKKSDKELYYLKWCYHDHFAYEPDCEEENFDYSPDPTKIFAISPSAAVCMVHRDEQCKEFLENTFQRNFQIQYLFTYVLLLHQKYMMYLFLTKMSVAVDNEQEHLENYKRRLYDFETKYMFSKVSEVPQYQRFHDKVKQAFALKEMFSDVQEPLSRLAEIRRRENEERQNKQEKRLNTALAMLSLLAIVSAFTDATGIVTELSWMIPKAAARVIQLIAAGGVFAYSVFLLVRLFFLKNKR